MVLVAALSLAAFGGATPAQAAECPINYEQPFYAWDDYDWYGLAPGSTFATSSKPSGWTLKNALVVAGGNPHRPFSDGYSLYLKPGGYAITSPFCIDQLSPYSRMFAVTTTPNAAYPDGLKVEVMYTDAVTRRTVTRPVGTLGQEGAWNATAKFPLITTEMSPRWDSYGRATAKYKFTAINGTAWRIDDLFIDPKRH